MNFMIRNVYNKNLIYFEFTISFYNSTFDWLEFHPSFAGSMALNRRKSTGASGTKQSEGGYYYDQSQPTYPEYSQNSAAKPTNDTFNGGGANTKSTESSTYSRLVTEK